MLLYLLAVLKWNIVCIFVQHLPRVLKLLPLQGATASTRDTQGAASLALGYGLHWAFSPPLLNPKLELSYLTTFEVNAYSVRSKCLLRSK